MIRVLGSSLVVVFFFTNCVLSNEDVSIDKEELVALNRDGFARENFHSDFTGGFLAAWPVVLYLIAGMV